MKIVKELTINSNIEKVYRTFHDFEHWVAALPDVLDVELHYDDGFHQEFSMIVERKGTEETVRGIRFCSPNNTIELFQTSPPPLFKHMTGSWKFTKETRKRTRVTATRHFEMHDKDQLALEVAKNNLCQYLAKNLLLFKDYIESDHAN